LPSFSLTRRLFGWILGTFAGGETRGVHGSRPSFPRGGNRDRFSPSACRPQGFPVMARLSRVGPTPVRVPLLTSCPGTVHPAQRVRLPHSSMAAFCGRGRKYRRGTLAPDHYGSLLGAGGAGSWWARSRANGGECPQCGGGRARLVRPSGGGKGRRGPSSAEGSGHRRLAIGVLSGALHRAPISGLAH